MNIRTVAAALALSALAGGAHAERLHTGGLPVTNNMVIGTNMAAGIGNQAQQQLMASQGPGPVGPGGVPLVITNTQVGTNVAAGIGNTARQGIVGLQGGGGPQVGLDFSGRGPLVTTNTAVNTNIAAGLNNSAAQGVLARQR